MTEETKCDRCGRMYEGNSRALPRECPECGGYVTRNTVDRLRADLARMTTERDRAIAELQMKGACDFCNDAAARTKSAESARDAIRAESMAATIREVKAHRGCLRAEVALAVAKQEVARLVAMYEPPEARDEPQFGGQPIGRHKPGEVLMAEVDRLTERARVLITERDALRARIDAAPVTWKCPNCHRGEGLNNRCTNCGTRIVRVRIVIDDPEVPNG